jgi:phage shock protein E
MIEGGKRTSLEMPTQITREDVQRLTAEGAVLIDTLSEGEYAEDHITGAVNIPLKKLNRESTSHLAKDAPLIVYCYDRD